jgi:hypothetical protein
MKKRLLLLVFPAIILVSVLVSVFPSSAKAFTPQDTADAKKFCATAKFSNNIVLAADYQIDCATGYVHVKSLQEAGVAVTTQEETAFCNTAAFSGQHSVACSIGWSGAASNSKQAPPTTTEICSPWSGDKLSTCTQVMQSTCAKYSTNSNTDNAITDSRNCFNGAYAKLQNQTNPCNASDEPCNYGYNNTELPIPDSAKQACKDYAPGAPHANTSYYSDCIQGFTDGNNNKTQDEACGNSKYPKGGDGQKACVVGWQASSAGANGKGDDTSACIANSNTTLEWLACPLITAMSKSAELLNSAVEKQLDFHPADFLPNDGPAHKAWNVIKDLVSSVLIIILLIMVISQSIGTGVFEAYTVKKILPRLVIAVVAMQLSWDLCIFLINFVDSLGTGLASLLAAPFGGPGNLDLGSLLNHEGPGAGVTVEVTLTAALVSAGFLGATFLPGAFLIAFSIFMAVLVGLASVLLRNIIIIACVLFSPLALLVWVMPGSAMQGYWKQWRENFTKVLLLFPLMIGIIYAGRIFAYVAGGAKNVGVLNIIMILVGFFAPYYFLPKAFKYGGSLMSQAAKAAESNAAIRKGREVGRKELGDWQKRRIGAQAKKYDPSNADYVKWRRGKFGLPVVAGGKLGQTMLSNLKAGRVIPTPRSMATTIQKGEQWSGDEDAIEAAKIKRAQDKAAADPSRVKSFSVDENGNLRVSNVTLPTQAGKMAIMEAMGSADDRTAGMAIERFLDTQSFVELGSNLVPVKDEGLKQKLRASGAEVFTPTDVQIQENPDLKDTVFVRGYELPRWQSKLNASEKLYPLPMGKWTMATSHIVGGNHESENRPTNLNPKLRREYAQAQVEENIKARQEGRAPKQMPRFQKLNKQQARAVATMQDYLSAENIGNQSESEIREFNRLAKQNPVVADEFARLLQRIGEGSQEGVNVIGRLASSASEREAVNNLLANAQIKAEVDGRPVDLTTSRIQADAQARLQGNLENDNVQAAVAGQPSGTAPENLPSGVRPAAPAPGTAQAPTTAPAASSTGGGGGATGASGGEGGALGAAGYGEAQLGQLKELNRNLKEFAQQQSHATQQGGEREVTVNLRQGERYNPQGANGEPGRVILPNGVGRDIGDRPNGPNRGQ